MAAKNTYADVAELIKDYTAQSVDDYLAQSISVNGVTLTCDVYRVTDGSTLTSDVFTGCTAVDANTQIIIGRNLSVASGVTLTPPYRCKGLIIGSSVQFINEGTISMTSRGASAAGQNIKLVTDYTISATGGSAGSTASGLSCAGGGNGARVGSGGSAGSGGTGTSYSGGAGGAGNGNQTANMPAGSSSGGAGGSGSFSGSYTGASCGGAGNPGGQTAANSATSITNGSGGTGGLLVIFADILNQSGSLTSQGSTGGGATHSGGAWNAGGGGSGGGCVVLLSKSSTITGTYNVNGGAGGVCSQSGSGAAANGGAGGTGKYAAYTVADLDISVPIDASLGLTYEKYLEDIEPVDGRILGMLDKDELFYEINGTRHRAMDTDVGFEDCHTRGEQVPDTIEVNISNPTDGQLLKYNATSQKWENATVETKHEYSTTEKVVGTWIDGKPVYEKTFSNIGSQSSINANIIYEHQLPIDTPVAIVSCNGYRHDNGANVCFPYYANTQNGGPSLNAGVIIFGSTGFGVAYDNICITIQYTKTTDTPTVQS